jgi:hypothetical protein
MYLGGGVGRLSTHAAEHALTRSGSTSLATRSEILRSLELDVRRWVLTGVIVPIFGLVIVMTIPTIEREGTAVLAFEQREPGRVEADALAAQRLLAGQARGVIGLERCDA